MASSTESDISFPSQGTDLQDDADVEKAVSFVPSMASAMPAGQNRRNQSQSTTEIDKAKVGYTTSTSSCSTLNVEQNQTDKTTNISVKQMPSFSVADLNDDTFVQKSHHPEVSSMVNATTSCHSLLLDANVGGGSLASSINDLSYEADQLDKAIRRNDTAHVQRILLLHHAELPMNPHGSLLDKSSDGSQSQCIGQEAEVLLRKSNTYLDRVDHRNSFSEHETPQLFTNVVHRAVECNSHKVAHLLLRTGFDPNEAGISPSVLEIWRRGSCSAASEGNLSPTIDKTRRSSHLLTPGAARFSGSPPSVHSDTSNGGSSGSQHSSKPLVVSKTSLSTKLRTVYVSSEGRNVLYDEEYSRDTLFTLPPLFLSVAMGNAVIVHLLLKYGALPNVQDKHGISPLHLAACQEKKSWSCIRILLERGAKVSLKNKQGISPAQLIDTDLRVTQLSLIEDAFNCFSQTKPSRSSFFTDIIISSGQLKTNILKKIQEAKNPTRQVPRAKEFLLVDEGRCYSPEEASFSSYHDSFHSQRQSLKSQENTSIYAEEERSAEYSDKINVLTDGAWGRDPNFNGRNSVRRKSRDEPMKPRIKIQQGYTGESALSHQLGQAEISLRMLTLMASNVECLLPILNCLQRHQVAVIELTEQVGGHGLHNHLAALLNRLTQTTVDEFCQSPSDHPEKNMDTLSGHLCKLLHLSIGFLRGGQSLQFTALLLMNRAIDMCVVHPVPYRLVPRVDTEATASSTGKPYCPVTPVDSGEKVPLAHVVPSSVTCMPWITSSEIGTSSCNRWWLSIRGRNSKKNQKSNSISDGSPDSDRTPFLAKSATPDTLKTQDTESCMEILTTYGIDLILNALNNGITLHKRAVGNRNQCCPSNRKRSCSYHCLQILSARAILYCTHDDNVQKKLMEEVHLKILIGALDPTHDPQLLCLLLQVVALLALNHTNHAKLQEAEFPDSLTQLVLPSDEWFYTNQSTKYSLYVKHHASRSLVYLGHELRLRGKVNLFELLEYPMSPTQKALSEEDSYIITTSLSPSTVMNEHHKLLGISTEALLLEMLQDIEMGIQRGEPRSEEGSKRIAENQGPSISVNRAKDNDLSISFYLESLPMVIHPVVILRLLLHRLLSLSMMQRPWTNTASRSSVGSGENRSRASSEGLEESLSARRKVNLTIDCSQPTLPSTQTEIAEQKASTKDPLENKMMVPQMTFPVTVGLQRGLQGEMKFLDQIPTGIASVAGPSHVQPKEIHGMQPTMIAAEKDSGTSKECSPSSSPAVKPKRSFRFSSRRSKKIKPSNEVSFSSSQSDEKPPREIDIVALQRELQNLPNFDTQKGSSYLRELMDTQEPLYCRSRSCSVPRVIFDAPSTSLQPPHIHGLLIRSATTEGTYQPRVHSSSSLSPGKTTHPPESPILLTAELTIGQKAVFELLLEWARIRKKDFTDNPDTNKELKDFIAKAACLGEKYQCWIEELKNAFSIKEAEEVNKEEADICAINEEYMKLQRLVVSGDLPCSKEDAAVLAGIQLRIEETWPSTSKEASASGTMADQRHKLKPITEDAKEATSPEPVGAMARAPSVSNAGDVAEHDESMSSFNNVVMRVTRSTAVFRNWMSSNGNKATTVAATNFNLDDCVPPVYQNTKNMAKSIKEQKRKLFHSSVYENELNLKKLYIQTCRRLPAFGCRMFQVKETLRGKTKKKTTRLLGIGPDKLVLLDSKTLLLSKYHPMSELRDWRSGGGRSHDQILLEFRATKWSFVATSQGTQRSICSELWEVMQDLDTHFLTDNMITTREVLDREIRKNVMMTHCMERTSLYREELECLQTILHFPEQVAMHLTEVEYGLFYSVDPINYVRQVTIDVSQKSSEESFSINHAYTVQALVKRFKEVSSWVTHIIISQPTHEDRKAVLSCILRVAQSCWNFANFNAAMEILAGLKSEKLKPFWLSLTDKDNVIILDSLTDALMSDSSAEYRRAIDRALSSPFSKIIPFFGNFLRELRTVLKGIPSLLVLTSLENFKLDFVSDFQGEDHFMTRIGVGGIINVDKLRRTHEILDDIRAFHHHFAKRIIAEKKQTEMEKNGIEVTGEHDSLYEMDTSPHPSRPRLIVSDPFPSFFPISRESKEYQILKTLYHGTTVIHWDEDGARSALVYLRLEKSNGTITWCKPSWSALRGSGAQDYSLSINLEEHVCPGLLLKYESSDVAHNNLEEGFLDLASAKEITVGKGTVDLSFVSKKFGLEDLHPKTNCIRLLYGTNLSDNRILEFVAPSLVTSTWIYGLRYAISSLKKQKQLCDRRIYWLKEKYLNLYFDDLVCHGPTPAEAIKTFGGRKWTLGSLGGSCTSVDTSGSGFKRVPSFGVGTSKLRKKKSSSSLAAIRDCSPKSPASTSDGLSEMAFRRQSPSVRMKKSKCSPHFDVNEEGLSPGTSNGASANGSGSSFNVNAIRGLASSSIPNPALTSGYRERCQQRGNMGGMESPPSLVCGPVITHSSQMDFLQFADLFRSFLVRSRKDLRNVFEQIAVSSKGLPADQHSQKIKILPSCFPEEKPTKVLGLLTRNTPFDLIDGGHRKKICDAIAAASIVSNCAGVDTSKTISLGLAEFQQFLNVHQGEERSESEVAELIQRHEPDMTLRKKLCLSFEGFARYLMDKDNYAFVPECINAQQESLNQPLSHYYIASSHNTYLTGHQLKGESSVELYSQVLLTGCRCVELDCWDGDDGMPVIYHGHTLTTKIPFKSVVDAINKSAFVTSPYPVILSIENHCSIQQQVKMAQIFIAVFGEKLVTRFLFDSDFSEDPQLPSPNQLKYRVLIKNKKMRATMTPAITMKCRGKFTSGRTNSIISTASTGSFNDEDDDEYEDDEDDDDLLEESFQQSVAVHDQEDRHSSGTVSKSASLTVRTESLSSQEGSYKDKISTPGPSSKLQSIPADTVTDIFLAEEDKSRKSSSQIAPELSDLVVYCQAIKFRGFVANASPTNSVKIKKMSSKKALLATSNSGSMPNTPPLTADLKIDTFHSKRVPSWAPCYQVSSVNESTAKKLCKRHPLALVSHCESQLMRTYPAGMRIDSSNFNPVIFWAFGIQMVALNYQTEDSALHLNTAMFEQNGRCGYVLKPRVMWDRTHMMYGRFNPWEKVFDGLHALSISISVISGQYVCPATHTGSPQVEIEIIGIPVDCCRQKTKLVQRNSLNPIWNDTFHFRVSFSDLAFIRFSVMDMGTNHMTTQRVMPLTSLKQGYRHVRLRSIQNQILPLATLFINSSWEEEGLEIPNTNGDIHDGVGVGKKSKGKSKEPSTFDMSKIDSKDPVAGHFPVKRRMFFLMVYGIIPDETSTILKITQDSTAADVILQALNKTNSDDDPSEYVLIEEVHKGWDKRSAEKTTTQRFLDPNERPLEAQSHWQGEGRFILKKLGNDPSTRAWMSTVKNSAVNKEKRRQDAGELSGDELLDWSDNEEPFLVCVYDVSPAQPYAILRVPINSTAQDVLAQVLVKARRIEDPLKFSLVEEVEYPPVTEGTPTGAIRKKGIYREQRDLDDNENVFLAQQRWKAKGWFVLKEKEQLALERRKAEASKCSTLRKLSRLRISTKSTKVKQPLTPDRRVKSLNDGNRVNARGPWRQVHSEGEVVSDDDVKETTVMKLKRISLRKFRAWR